jgi:hypothetical protein
MARDEATTQTQIDLDLTRESRRWDHGCQPSLPAHPPSAWPVRRPRFALPLPSLPALASGAASLPTQQIISARDAHAREPAVSTAPQQQQSPSPSSAARPAEAEEEG